jgi:hypothetical protein
MLETGGWPGRAVCTFPVTDQPTHQPDGKIVPTGPTTSAAGARPPPPGTGLAAAGDRAELVDGDHPQLRGVALAGAVDHPRVPGGREHLADDNPGRLSPG